MMRPMLVLANAIHRFGRVIAARFGRLLHVAARRSIGDGC